MYPILLMESRASRAFQLISATYSPKYERLMLADRGVLLLVFLLSITTTTPN
jgi:hypothetical protein